MRKLNLAAIDIGSNAVRLLIKCVNSDLSEQPLSKIQLLRVPLRLGEDAFISYEGLQASDEDLRRGSLPRLRYLSDARGEQC